MSDPTSERARQQIAAKQKFFDSMKDELIHVRTGEAEPWRVRTLFKFVSDKGVQAWFCQNESNTVSCDKWLHGKPIRATNESFPYVDISGNDLPNQEWTQTAEGPFLIGKDPDDNKVPTLGEYLEDHEDTKGPEDTKEPEEPTTECQDRDDEVPKPPPLSVGDVLTGIICFVCIVTICVILPCVFVYNVGWQRCVEHEVEPMEREANFFRNQLEDAQEGFRRYEGKDTFFTNDGVQLHYDYISLDKGKTWWKVHWPEYNTTLAWDMKVLEFSPANENHVEYVETKCRAVSYLQKEFADNNGNYTPAEVVSDIESALTQSFKVPEDLTQAPEEPELNPEEGENDDP